MRNSYIITASDTKLDALLTKVIESLSSRLYSILEPQNEGLVVNECVRSSSTKKEVPMDKKNSNLKLKLVKTPKTLMIAFVFAVSMFSFEFDYEHTRDSSRADSITCSRPD